MNNLIQVLLLNIFILICGGLLCWGLSRKDRIYQYPFFMGFTLISFVLPQIIALINNPGSVPERAIQPTLLMSCLCGLMCWVGYQIPLPMSWINKAAPKLNVKRLKIGAIVYICIGLFFWILVYSSSEAANLNQYWSGKITIYVFFANLLNIGFAIFLLEGLKQPRLSNFLILMLPISILMYRAFLLGRRTTLAFTLFGIAVGVYFVYKKSLPRILAIFTILIALLIMINIAQYREFLATGKWSTLYGINPVENLLDYTNQEKQGTTLELRNAALTIDTVLQSGRYELGTGYWNTVVFRWIPAQLLGDEFKKNLQFSHLNYHRIWSEHYGYIHPSGSTITGIGDSFAQFDYFGSLIFALFAFVFKYLWYRSIYKQDPITQYFYILLIASGMTALTHGTGHFFAEFLYFVLFSLPIFWWSAKL